MANELRIAAYTRISVDIESEKDKNVSISHQKLIISDYCKIHFPKAKVDYFTDRDRSGYTFDEREDYQKLRPKLYNNYYDILIVKDLSRFSRRNGEGLYEFEKIAKSGTRIIAIGDDVDYSIDHTDDWMKVKVYFFVNEMDVLNASKKNRDIIKKRQERGEWICAVPYGYYFIDTQEMLYEVDEACAVVVRTIFDLYNKGWGYKKIANHLTEQNIPTPRMSETLRAKTKGKKAKRQVQEAWNHVTISEIVRNDFYIGTLRQRKYSRAGIKGVDKKISADQNIVIPDFHQPIVDKKTFDIAQGLLSKRKSDNYRGQKKYDNFYTGVLFCGDCESPMFSMSRSDLAPAYTCGTYHRRGLDGCTSHHIRTDFLDMVLKGYIKRVRDNSSKMLNVLNEVLTHEKEIVSNSESAFDTIKREITRCEKLLAHYAQEKAILATQDDIASKISASTYNDLIASTSNEIAKLQSHLKMIEDTTTATVQVNRVAKSVFEIFDNIIEKDKLDRQDIQFLVDRIFVYEDHIDIQLRSDIDELLKTGTIQHIKDECRCANFNLDTENNENATIDFSMVVAQSARNQRDKVFCVNVVNSGDPLEIYTDRDGEVIFKKYSPISELQTFAGEYADTLQKTAGTPVFVCDRDVVIAVAGASKREYLDRKISAELDEIIENRGLYIKGHAGQAIPIITDGGNHYVNCAMPILSEGDIIGCVVSGWQKEQSTREKISDEIESKLIQTAGVFLGKQMEG